VGGDYFFLRYDQSFFNNKLKISPVSGAFIVTDWSDIKNNYAWAYMPEIIYQATPNTEISLSSVFFDGKGSNFSDQTISRPGFICNNSEVVIV
jgi:hypothetical protein